MGLSRQNQNPDDPVKGWGTISNGSALSRQMIYGDPWLYGTVRSSRPGHDPRAFLTPGHPHPPPPPPPPGAPLLVVCSCPEFLCGTTRKLGSNCRKCGGHRLAGVPLGGTCRLPAPPSRSRPSLAGNIYSPNLFHFSFFLFSFYHYYYICICIYFSFFIDVQSTTTFPGLKEKKRRKKKKNKLKRKFVGRVFVVAR